MGNITLYMWPCGGYFGVVWRDRSARDRIAERLNKAAGSTATAVETRPLTGQTDLERGWERNLARMPAMLALGLAAI